MVNNKKLYISKSPLSSLSEAQKVPPEAGIAVFTDNNAPWSSLSERCQKTEFVVKSQQKPEKIVETYLKRRCDLNNWWCLKESVTGKRGWPDRTILPGLGKLYYVECKDRGKKPRPDQAAVHAALLARGFPVLLIDTKEKVQQLEFHIKFNIAIIPGSNLLHPEFKTRKTKNA